MLYNFATELLLSHDSSIYLYVTKYLLAIVECLLFRSDLSKIKEGEEAKTKNYTALCVTTDEVTEDIINKINQVGSVDVIQKTPIRVLHRRPLAERNKKIHSMEAKLIPGNVKNM